MCQSYIKSCECGQKSAEMMFGNMVLDEAAIAGLYCPKCSATVDANAVTQVNDNGWVLELDEDILKAYAPRMNADAGDITAEQAFDNGFVSWVGMTPEDNLTRSKEREAIMAKHAGNKLEQFQATKEWAIAREKKFTEEGWRKAVHK